MSSTTSQRFSLPASLVLVWGLVLTTAFCQGQALYSFGNLSAEEQLYMEFINRARANPPAEGARLVANTDPEVTSAMTQFGVDKTMLQSEFNAIAAQPPLAPNASLTTSARGHSNWLLANAAQSHDETNPANTPWDRINAAGYTYSTAGENVFSYAKSVWHGHAGFQVDWGAGSGGMQTGRGHRANILSGTFREIGVGVALGINGAVGPQLVTQDFGLRSSSPSFGTGVAYYDLNGNNFYDIGEGISGLTVNVSDASYYCTTAIGGGWTIPVPSSAATRTVTFSGLNVNQTVSLVVPESKNAKADLKLAYSPPTITSASTAAAGSPYTLAFNAVGGATEYKWSCWSLATAAAENCESLAGATTATTGSYSVLNTSVKQQGTASFHLENSTAASQSVQLSPLFYGQSSPSLSFQSSIRTSTTAEQFKVQVKEEGSAIWQDVSSQTGTNSSGSTSFAPSSAALGAMGGKAFRIRFLLNYSNGSYYPYSGANYGWFIDAIAFSGVATLSGSVTQTLAGTSGSFTPSLGSYLMSVTPVISRLDFPASYQTLTVAATGPPSIVSQPASVAISGGTATLTVAASGSSPTFQWYQGISGVTTNPISGATSASFTTPALDSSATYWVRVTNADGHVDSQTATVSILRFTLTTSGVHGTVAGDGNYAATTHATLVATADPGYLFIGWTGDASGMTNPLPLTMNSDKTVGATFSQESDDTDGDGLTDGQEVNILHTDPKLSDSNGNGVSDALEDFDGDGLTNLAELNQFGSNPLLADSNSDGLSDAYAACFVGTPIQPRVGNKISIDLKKLTTTGNTLKLVGTLPTGLTFSTTTGLISGTITGTPGTYRLSVQVLQGSKILRTVAFPVTVLAFPSSLIGNFESILEDANSIPVGAFKISIAKADSWTATLELAGAVKRYANGAFILSQGSPVAPVTAVFAATSTTPAVTVTLAIDGSNPTISGSYNGGTLRGFRLATGAENPPATVSYSLVLDAGEQDGINVPAGLGWMKGTVSNLGVGTFKGLLGDGTASSITLHLSSSGQAVLWAHPYTNKKSYLGGIITLGNLGQSANSIQKLTDRVWWSKAADVKTLSYPNGFPAMPLTIGTSKWVTPANATALGASLGWRNNRTVGVTIDGAGISNHDPQSAAIVLPTEFTLDDLFNLALSAPVISPRVPWSGKVASADGSFTGTFTLPSGFSISFLSGAAAASGVFVQDESWGSVTGCGLIKVPVSGITGSFRTAAFVFDQ